MVGSFRRKKTGGGSKKGFGEILPSRSTAEGNDGSVGGKCKFEVRAINLGMKCLSVAQVRRL